MGVTMLIGAYTGTHAVWLCSSLSPLGLLVNTLVYLALLCTIYAMLFMNVLKKGWGVWCAQVWL